MTLELAARAAIGEQCAQMGVRHQSSVERHGCSGGDADRLAAIDRDQDVLDSNIGMIFGCRYRVANGFLREVHADHRAGANALALAQRRADDAKTTRLGAADQAHRLRRTDIQHRHEARAIGRRFRSRSQFDRLSH